MGVSSQVQAGIRERLLHRLRALMSRTTANGATPEEELAAARMTAKVIAQLDGSQPPEAEPPKPNWAEAERNSREYQQLLEKTTTETLLKNAVEELALEQVNRIAPPRRKISGEQTERVDIHELLDVHLGMALSAGSSRLAAEILARAVDELVYEGRLPPHMDIPVAR
jgi:hypothetical protein